MPGTCSTGLGASAQQPDPIPAAQLLSAVSAGCPGVASSSKQQWECGESCWGGETPQNPEHPTKERRCREKAATSSPRPAQGASRPDAVGNIWPSTAWAAWLLTDSQCIAIFIRKTET